MFKDDIQNNEKLKDLSEDQRNELSEVYRNNEQIAINEVTSRNAKSIEDDIFALTGNEKQQGVKYFDYMKSEFTKQKEGSVSKAEFETLQGKYTTAQEQIKNGITDEVGKQKLADANARVNQLETDLQQAGQKHKKEFDAERLSSMKDTTRNEMVSFLNGKTPAGGMDKELYADVGTTKINAFLLTATPEKVSADNGTSFIQFRDVNGDVMLNPDNSRRPFTVNEMSQSILGTLIQKPGSNEGAGTNNGQGDNTNVPSIGSAKTQGEADTIITKQLRTEGLVSTSDEYTKRFKEIRDANKVRSLPLR